MTKAFKYSCTLATVVLVSLAPSSAHANRFGFTVDSITLESAEFDPGARRCKVIVQYTARKAQLIANQGTGLIIGWIGTSPDDMPSEGRAGDLAALTLAGMRRSISASGVAPTQNIALFFIAPTKPGNYTLFVGIYESSGGGNIRRVALARERFRVKGQAATSDSGRSEKPDLVIESVRFGSSTKRAGKTFGDIYVTIVNKGGATRRATDLWVWPHMPDTPRAGSTPYDANPKGYWMGAGSFEAGQRKTLKQWNGIISVPNVPGHYVFRFMIDGSNVIEESDESNNYYLVPYTVR